MSLVTTLAQEFRIATPDFDKFEFRIAQAGAYSVFKRQSDSGSSWLTPELKSRAFASIGHTTKIPVINYKDVTLRTTRPITIAADDNTSALYTVTWSTIAYGFKMYPAEFHNNEIGFQKDFNTKMKAMVIKMKSTMDSAAVVALDAAKTQVVTAVTGGHTFASNVVSETALATLKDSYVLADISPMMDSNSFMDYDMDIVGNPGLNSILRRMDGFGAYNQENKTLQFDGKNFHFSNNIANAALKSATGFAVADGSLAMLTRVERDALYETKLKTGHEWGTVTIPGIEILAGTYVYDEVVDLSGGGAHQADLSRTGAQVFDFAFDYAMIVPYNSAIATIPAPILKFDIALA
jgi:hypothetical protein